MYDHEDFSELVQAWVDRKITYEQMRKADENKWDLEFLLWWENTTFWQKLKRMLGIT